MEEAEKAFAELENLSVRPDVKKQSGAWKVFERSVADFFGTTRSPLSGMIKAVTNSDTLHRQLYIECKYRAVFAIVQDYFEKYALEEKEQRLATKFRPKEGRIRKATIYRVRNHKKYQDAIYVFSPEDIGRVLAGVSFVEGRPRIYTGKVDISDYKADGILSLYAETELRAKLEEKTPVICIKMKNKAGWLIGISPKYLEILRSYGR